MNEINKNTYEEISDEFSNTRAYVWKSVRDFTNMITGNANIIEVGCGNGKNMEYILNNDKILISNIFGIDSCSKFVNICQKKNLNVIEGCATKLQFEDSTFDYLLCIAMFHHLLFDNEKDLAMKEFLRVMKIGAYGIITCWATEQPIDSKFKFISGINEVPWLGTCTQVPKSACTQVPKSACTQVPKSACTQVPKSACTQVPKSTKEVKEIKKITNMRYYYVYNETTFRKYFSKFDIDILNIYNEVGNWILLFRKIK